jgi:hypothetical protein
MDMSSKLVRSAVSGLSVLAAAAAADEDDLILREVLEAAGALRLAGVGGRSSVNISKEGTWVEAVALEKISV